MKLTRIEKALRVAAVVIVGAALFAFCAELGTPYRTLNARRSLVPSPTPTPRVEDPVRTATPTATANATNTPLAVPAPAATPTPAAQPTDWLDEFLAERHPEAKGPEPDPFLLEARSLATAAAQPTTNAQRFTRARGSEILLANDLTPAEKSVLQDGLDHLRSCAPTLYEYVSFHVAIIGRDPRLPLRVRPARAAAVVPGMGLPIVLITPGTLTDPAIPYPNRVVWTAGLLAHEARHLVMGTNEPDAYHFELLAFTPACTRNDQDPEWFDAMKAYVEWRASLPYPGEPPEEAIPPQFR